MNIRSRNCDIRRFVLTLVVGERGAIGQIFTRLRNSSDSVLKSLTLVLGILSRCVWSTWLCILTHSMVFIFLNSILKLGTQLFGSKNS